jgi:thiosulfate/3-mercaptopyruvate sulfurtransferase
VQLRMIAAALMVLLLAACRQETAPRDPVPETTAQPAASTNTAGTLFVDAPDAGAQIIFVGQDSTVRPADWNGAVFVPLSTFSVERDGIPNEFPRADSMAALLGGAGVSGDRFVIVGDPIPAGRAWAAFDYLGLGARAALLDGGRAALGNIAPPPPAVSAVDTGAGLAVDVRNDMIVDAEWVHERLGDDGIAILDARPPAEFSGETPGDGIDRPGHIPGARNVFWQTLVVSADEPRLKAEAELRRIFEEAGVAPDDTIVAYCRTGGQASFLYTVARHLGYDVLLYDGSYIDWSRTQYPVER